MKLKMLVADDHRLFIEGIKLVLQDVAHVSIDGYVLNGKDAIDKCRKGEFHFVLMDINMPIIDGIEATREIKRLNPEIKVLMISMLSDYASVEKALKAGADGYLIKSADSKELLKAIRCIQNGEIYLSETLSKLFNKDHTGNLTTQKDYIRFTENLITPREQSVLKLIVEGFTNKQIADTLSISVKTADTHRKNMLAKLSLPNTAALVKFAIENKLIY
jgi:DNA-binding NarL/FixJ family response regulator